MLRNPSTGARRIRVRYVARPAVATSCGGCSLARDPPFLALLRVPSTSSSSSSASSASSSSLSMSRKTGRRPSTGISTSSDMRTSASMPMASSPSTSSFSSSSSLSSPEQLKHSLQLQRQDAPNYYPHHLDLPPQSSSSPSSYTSTREKRGSLSKRLSMNAMRSQFKLGGNVLSNWSRRMSGSQPDSGGIATAAVSSHQPPAPPSPFAPALVRPTAQMAR